MQPRAAERGGEEEEDDDDSMVRDCGQALCLQCGGSGGGGWQEGQKDEDETRTTACSGLDSRITKWLDGNTCVVH